MDSPSSQFLLRLCVPFHFVVQELSQRLRFVVYKGQERRSFGIVNLFALVAHELLAQALARLATKLDAVHAVLEGGGGGGEANAEFHGSTLNIKITFASRTLFAQECETSFCARVRRSER